MGHFLAFVCALGFLVPVSANAVELTVRLTGKWLKMNQEFESNNTQPGEFAETKRDARIRYELRSEGILAAWDQNKEYTDNKVLGVELEGVSTGQLLEEKGKYYWRIKREWKDKAGKEKKVEKDFEISFTKGDFAAFEAGDVIEAVFTKEAQKTWNEMQTEVVTKYAEDLRAEYAAQYPKATLAPVEIESNGNKIPVKLKGDVDKMTVTGSDTFQGTKLKASF